MECARSVHKEIHGRRTHNADIHTILHYGQRSLLSMAGCPFPSRLLLVAFAAALRLRLAVGNVLLVAYEETEQDMLSLFEDNLGRSSMQ